MDNSFEKDWRVRGECADRNPDMWFSTAGKKIREAKRLCRLCAVREECLAFAVESSIPHGVWGGMSESERRRLPAAGLVGAASR